MNSETPLPSGPEVVAQSAPLRVNAEQWNSLRIDFNRSLLVDTSLFSLAENIDGCVWPLSGPDETPSAYIDFTYDEVIEKLAEKGQPATRLDNLVDILRGTMAFDESFGDMAGIASKAEAETDPVKRNLERLEISPDYPVSLCNFTPGMHDFCQREKLETLNDFLSFTRGASRQVFISGEFKELLNAISHIDEQEIARFLPFRIHSSGLHFLEALAFVIRPLSPEERAVVTKRPESLSPEALERVRGYARYFKDEISKLRSTAASGTPLGRLAAPLNDLALEPGAAALLGLLLREANAASELEVKEIAKSAAKEAAQLAAKEAEKTALAKPAVKPGAPASGGFGGFLRKLFGSGR